MWSGFLEPGSSQTLNSCFEKHHKESLDFLENKSRNLNFENLAEEGFKWSKGEIIKNFLNLIDYIPYVLLYNPMTIL